MSRIRRAGVTSIRNCPSRRAQQGEAGLRPGGPPRGAGRVGELLRGPRCRPDLHLPDAPGEETGAVEAAADRPARAGRDGRLRRVDQLADLRAVAVHAPARAVVDPGQVHPPVVVVADPHLRRADREVVLPVEAAELVLLADDAQRDLGRVPRVEPARDHVPQLRRDGRGHDPGRHGERAVQVEPDEPADLHELVDPVERQRRRHRAQAQHVVAGVRTVLHQARRARAGLRVDPRLHRHVADDVEIRPAQGGRGRHDLRRAAHGAVHVSDGVVAEDPAAHEPVAREGLFGAAQSTAEGVGDVGGAAGGAPDPDVVEVTGEPAVAAGAGADRPAGVHRYRTGRVLGGTDEDAVAVEHPADPS